MIVIIPCGGRKLPGTHPAHELYTGSYHGACKAWALSVVATDQIYILSAKYGLLGWSDPTQSYGLMMGDPGSVSVAKVRAQAATRQLLAEDVIAVGGAKYIAYCRAIWPNCQTPLPKARMGTQMAAMKHNHGRLPETWR